MALPENYANSLFEGLNSKSGLMICGYEWGDSKEDQRREREGTAPKFDRSAICTFSNKVPAYGEDALSWPYDNRIIKWFELWGHPLSRNGLGGRFEQCIVQTNWCDSQGQQMQQNIRARLVEKWECFIARVREREPSLILLMGSAMIDVLQREFVLKEFSKIVGTKRTSPRKIRKDFDGRRFRIGFQSFENCEVVSLPHPSGSIGLSDDYVKQFEPEMNSVIKKLRSAKSA